MSSPFPGSVLGGSTRPPVISANLASVRARARESSLQQRLVLVGALLALGMVAVLYQVLSDNIAQLESKRLARLEAARALHACAMMPTRLERDQCKAALAEPSIETNTQLAGSSDEPQDGTVLAGR